MYIIKTKTSLNVGEYLDLELKEDIISFVKEDEVLFETEVKEKEIFKNRKLKGVVRKKKGNEYEVMVVRFADLHRHSGYSLLDGGSKIEDLVDKTEYVGALTDHGNMFGFLKYYKAMKKAGKQPIVGFEAYVETIEGEKNGNHLVLLAKNEVGYKNIIKLTSLSYHNFYIKPHVSLQMLKERHEGIICLSACLGGEIPKKVVNNYEKAKEVAKIYKEMFGDDFYIEIQNHNIGEEEDEVNKGLIKLAKELQIKLVATTDSHYANIKDKEHHDMLLALSTGRTLSDAKRMRFDGDGYHLHSADDMDKRFSFIPEAIDNTLEIAEKCSSFELELGKTYFPKFDIPKGFTEETYFEHLVHEGFKERFEDNPKIFNSKEYQDRLKIEVDTIKQMGYPAYFLIVWDFIKYAKDNGIMVGPGRGSAAGSLVSYCLKITDLDPIPYGLLFERFLNPERVSLPDIDVDFCYERREEVIDYVRNKYGEDAVSGIVTFGTFAARSAARDVTRVMEFPYSLGDEIAKAIPATPGMTINKALEENPELNKMYEENGSAKKIIDGALKIEGLPRHSSTHACFDKDTLINTSNGFKKIIDVRNGDKVLTHKKRYMPVVNTITTKTDIVYEIKAASSYPIEVTGNHPILTREMKLNGYREKTFSNPKWKPASNIEVGKDYLGIPINQNSIIPNDDNYDLPFNTDSFWWLIGRYLGDGWIEAKTRNGKISHEEYIVMSCPKNNKEVVNIERVLNELGFKYRIQDTRTTFKFYITEPELFNYVLNFGFYAHNKELNKDVLNLPISLSKRFIEGYLSADGSYRVSENRHFASSVSKKLTIGMMQLINKVYKRPVTIQVEEPGIDIIEGRKVNRKKRYLISFTKDKRKKERSFYEDGYIWSRVSHANKIKEQRNMYNLTVLDDSSYTANNVSVHNCGVIISDKSVDEYMPEFMSGNAKEGKEITSQVTMAEVEELGLLKFDFLGLKTMSIIGRSIKAINKTKEEKIQYLDIPINDPYIYEYISLGKTQGVFQLESQGMRGFMKDLYSDVSYLIKKIEKKYQLKGFSEIKGKGENKKEYKEEMEKLGQELFERLIAGISLYRPGPLDYIPNYLEGIRNPDKIEYLTPKLKPILEATYGTVVYQEQVMKIVQSLAGYSLGRADIVRRAMGKKKLDVMEQEKNYFINGKVDADGNIEVQGCVRNGIKKEIAEEIWEQMADFSKYAFNKSHKVCGII